MSLRTPRARADADRAQGLAAVGAFGIARAAALGIAGTKKTMRVVAGGCALTTAAEYVVVREGARNCLRGRPLEYSPR
jgi:hypothetical protein